MQENNRFCFSSPLLHDIVIQLCSSRYCFFEMSKRPIFDDIAGPDPNKILLDAARPVWLDAPGASPDRFLLLEDTDTGDVLMPLVYMKGILDSNYSRKLASIKHRSVTLPMNADEELRRHNGLLHWHYAFEAPSKVKSLVRELVGDKVAQGHLKLVLLPAVYNALSARFDELKENSKPLIYALHYAMKRSSYWPLLCHPNGEVMRTLEAGAYEMISNLHSAGELQYGNGGAQHNVQIFSGPISLLRTARKYMFKFSNQKEMEASKRARTAGTPALASRHAPGGPTHFSRELSRTARELEDMAKRGIQSIESEAAVLDPPSSDVAPSGLQEDEELRQILMQRYPLVLEYIDKAINSLRREFDSKCSWCLQDLDGVKSSVVKVCEWQLNPKVCEWQLREASPDKPHQLKPPSIIQPANNDGKSFTGSQNKLAHLFNRDEYKKVTPGMLSAMVGQTHDSAVGANMVDDASRKVPCLTIRAPERELVKAPDSYPYKVEDTEVKASPSPNKEQNEGNGRDANTQPRNILSITSADQHHLNGTQNSFSIQLRNMVFDSGVSAGMKYSVVKLFLLHIIMAALFHVTL